MNVDDTRFYPITDIKTTVHYSSVGRFTRFAGVSDRNRRSDCGDRQQSESPIIVQ